MGAEPLLPGFHDGTRGEGEEAMLTSALAAMVPDLRPAYWRLSENFLAQPFDGHRLLSSAMWKELPWSEVG
jgi:hypothetical protein